MSKQTINVGSGELTGDGESLRSAFQKINSNFTELYGEKIGPTGPIGPQGPAGISADQLLNTTNTVKFVSLTVTNSLVVGGFPLNDKGIFPSIYSTLSTTLVVGNYNTGTEGSVLIRGYGQNRTNGTSSSGGQASIYFESSRGTSDSPLPLNTSQILGQLSAGGYDGNKWTSQYDSNPQNNLYSPGNLFFSSAETWTNSFGTGSNTLTNVGTQFGLQLQPPGTRLDATSRQRLLQINWGSGTQGATSNAPGISNVIFGNGISSTPTLTGSTGSFSHTGFGTTFIQGVNSNFYLFSTPNNEVATFIGDISNSTLNVTSVVSGRISIGQRIFSVAAGAWGSISTGTVITGYGTGSGLTGTYTINQSQTVNSTTLYSGPDNHTYSSYGSLIGHITGRRSGVAGRRNALKAGDRIGAYFFNSQFTDNSLGSGATVAEFSSYMLEDATISARGSNFQLRTVTSGTTLLSTRLHLDSDGHLYNSNVHRFESLSSATIAELTTSSASFNTHVIPNTNNNYDLGSSSNTWRNLYLNGLNITGSGTDFLVNSMPVTKAGSLSYGTYTIAISTSGCLVFPDGTVQNTAFESNTDITAFSVSTLTNKTIDVSTVTGNILKIQGNSITAYSGSGNTVAFTNNPTFNALTLGSSSLISLDGGQGSLYWAGQTGVAQAGINMAGFYRTLTGSNNALFTFAASGNGNMSVGVEGSLFVGTNLPNNNAGLNSDYAGWLVVQAGGKFGGDINTLGAVKFDSTTTGYVQFADNTVQNTAFTTSPTLNILKINKGVHENFQSQSGATGVITHDCSLGHVFRQNIPTSNYTANFTNLNLSTNYVTAVSIVITQGVIAYIPNVVQIEGVTQTINWQGTYIPVPSPNRIDVVTFSIFNNGGSYTVLGQLSGF